MIGEHAGRDHATLSASSAHRWLTCTPSALLEAQFPDTTSEAAREGTLAHELCEIKVTNYFRTNTPEMKKQTAAQVRKIKKDPLWQDEMEGYTDDYLDAIKSIALSSKEKPVVAVEERVDFSEWVPGGFGTADCILIRSGVLHVVDFKYGKGVPVAAENNPQMQLYALGAWQMFGMLYPIDTVRMTIVQPRLKPEPETWEIPLPQLMQFAEYVKQRAELAAKGEGDYTPGVEQCRFCRARAQCRARAEENVRLAGFKNLRPPLITAAEAGELLRMGEDLAAWLSDLQDWALGECLAGGEVPGWKAVEGRGSRVWTDQDKALETIQASGVDEAVLYERKPLTLAAIEKLMGKKQFAEVAGEYVEKKPGKPALVKESDKRPAISNKMTAAEAFGDEGELPFN